MTLLIRMDKIGDLVSTLPVDTIIPDSESRHWIISKGLHFLTKYSQPAREATEISLDKKIGYKEFCEFLKKHKPSSAIVFYAPWWVSYALWKEKIPARIGRRSQWYSFLFYTDSLRQSRSSSEKHEAQYNLELLRFALEKLKIQPRSKAHTVADSSANSDDPADFLKIEPPNALRILERLSVSKKQFVVVHPGMTGSALNWPQEQWNQLIEQLVTKTVVVITGTAADDPWLTQIKPKWQHHPQVRWAQEMFDLVDLLSLLNFSGALIAPSTGVAHLAAAVETPVVGLYPPLQSQHPRRWGPRSTQTPSVITPDVQCPAKIHCLKKDCAHYSCMKMISVEQVYKIISQKLSWS